MTIYVPPNHHDDDDQKQKQLQAQLEAQAQAELQAQAQLEAQGQGQAQHQSQESDNYNTNLNGNGNGNGNLNLNGNANLNANVNINKTEVCVDVKVNADVCTPCGPEDNHQYGIDMSHTDMCFPDNEGIINVNPEVINQNINGDHAHLNVLFNLDQVNNLVDNDKAEHIKNSDGCSSFCFGDVKGEGGDISIGGSDGKDGHGGPPKIEFGGHDDDGSGAGVQIGSNNGAGSTNSTLVDASGNVSIDALTQSIVLGANVQTNSFNMNNAGGDITVTDHGSDHHA